MVTYLDTTCIIFDAKYLSLNNEIVLEILRASLPAKPWQEHTREMLISLQLYRKINNVKQSHRNADASLNTGVE